MAKEHAAALHGALIFDTASKQMIASRLAVVGVVPVTEVPLTTLVRAVVGNRALVLRIAVANSSEQPHPDTLATLTALVQCRPAHDPLLQGDGCSLLSGNCIIARDLEATSSNRFMVYAQLEQNDSAVAEWQIRALRLLDVLIPPPPLSVILPPLPASLPASMWTDLGSVVSSYLGAAGLAADSDGPRTSRSSTESADQVHE
ncbi:hypothetical protein BC828DRAFT_403341, partial [Blastocladiella britannica]